MPGWLVTATDTDAGKTWITGALVGVLREAGIRAVAWKPVQSGATAGDPASDSHRLKWLGGLEEPEEMICPHSFAEPLAPALAARRAGQSLSPAQWRRRIAELLEEYTFVFVEGAGGITVPLADGYRVADLAADAGLPVLVVARAGLGTVNHIVLTVHYALSRGLSVAGVILNGYGRDGGSLAEETNEELIRESVDVPLLGRVPWLPGTPKREEILEIVGRHVDLPALCRGAGIVWPAGARMIEEQSRRGSE
ncbi:MAG: dethiobiotin synthase [Alicyclobacillaceae bacterium]|nr:dethiobiotin synthase [Alicyclobacillaceae bacterium]